MMLTSTVKPKKHSRGGYVMVLSLIAITGLMALLAMIVADQHAAIEQTQTRLRERRAEAAAEAAIARAISVVQESNSSLVTQNDDWAQLGTDQTSTSGPYATEAFDQGDGSTFRVQILDASSLINLNLASQQPAPAAAAETQLQTELQSELNALPLEQQQVDCLLDWVGTNPVARSDGATDSYYNGLTQPYNTRLGALTTVDELLLVSNWTAQTLYQPSTITGVSATATPPTDANGNIIPLIDLFTIDSGAPNTTATGTARTNLDGTTYLTALRRLIGVSQANIIAYGAATPPRGNPRVKPYTSFQTLLRTPGISMTTISSLLNNVTFSAPATRTQGKINLNTATQAVLQTLPGLTAAQAASIVTQQTTGFSTYGQLATMPGITRSTLGQVADYLGVGSDTWIVHAYGECGGVGVPLEVVLRLTSGQVQVVRWSRVNCSAIPTWWNWPAQVDTTEDAGALQ
ncbi:MAG: helix-hairpin-helix domain-containing protein [Capsulimonadaceae bacterium]